MASLPHEELRVTDIPDPPPGSDIRREESPEGALLSWPGHSRARGTMLTVAFALAVVALVVGIVLAATLFREGTPYEGVGYAVVAGLLISASFLATLLAFRLRMLFRERIALEADAIAWTPAVSATDMSAHFGWGGGGTVYGHSGRVARGLFHTALETAVLWRKQECMRIPRSGITDLRLEGKGRFEHLTISVGETDIDIAKRLSHDHVAEPVRRCAAHQIFGDKEVAARSSSGRVGESDRPRFEPHRLIRQA